MRLIGTGIAALGLLVTVSASALAGPGGNQDILPPIPGLVFCEGELATIVLDESQQGTVVEGTAGDDVVVGTNGDDIFHGKGGDDLVCLLDGDDVFANVWLIGDDGQDTVYGGRGNDELHGGDNNDSLIGGRGSDELDGGDGNDFCKGGKGKDTAAECETEQGIP